MSRTWLRSDAGLTRFESTLAMSVVLVGLLVGAGFLVRMYTASLDGQSPPAVQIALPDLGGDDGPESVSVVAPGTIALPSDTKADPEDACPDLRGIQPSGFDCSLPLYVPALDLSAVRVKARYQCPDAVNYRLVKGQSVQADKKCVLKTASRSGS